MSKILQNTTASPVPIADVGITVSASGNYTINPNDYLLFAASGNTISLVGAGTLTVSDGSSTLSIEQGVALLQGIVTDVTIDASAASSSYPDPSSVAGSPAPVNQDSFGNLQVRGTVLSDEGSFRDDFVGSALTTALTGTLSFVNGNTIVSGSGTTFTSQIKQGQYVKVTSQSETAYTQVLTVDSDTQLTLIQGYLGATASGVAAVVSNWETTTATGAGSIVVSTSLVNLASGITSGQSCNIIRIGDYLPYTLQTYASVSQRIANQTSIIGFVDAYPNPTKQAIIQFTGTTNTSVNFITSASAAAADTQTTMVVLPNNGTTNGIHFYKIDLSSTQATLSIDGIVLATNTLHLPGPYDNLQVIANIVNTATAASSTTVALDAIFFENLDLLQVKNSFSGEPVPVVQNQTSATGLLTSTQVVTLETSGSIGATAELSGTWTGTVVFEGIVGATWQAMDVFSDAVNGEVIVTSATTNGNYAFANISGYSQVRVRGNTVGSGTLNVFLNANATPFNYPIYIADNAGNLPSYGVMTVGTDGTTSRFNTTLNTLPTGTEYAMVVRPIPSDGVKTTYSACTTALAPVATATDIFTLTGSATKTIRLLRMGISATQTTAGTVSVLFLRRSTADTGGTSTAPTIVQHDTADAAASATVLQYTANPTTGTLVGNIRTLRLEVPAAAGTLQPWVEFDFGNVAGKAIVLRGTSQVFAVNLNSTTVTGGSFNMYFEWSEE